MPLELTPKQLHELLFRSCTVALDSAQSHFIRRTSGNQLANAIVCAPATVELLTPLLTSELFHIQTINEDSLHYCVIWERVEWEHSNERRRIVRETFLATDLSNLTRRAKDIQLVLIIKSLMKSNIFDRDKSVALAKSLTDDGEEAYRDKARDLRKRLHDTLMGAFGNHQIYFPLDEIIKSIDDRRLLTPSTPDSSPIQPPDSTPVHDSTPTQA